MSEYQEVTIRPMTYMLGPIVGDNLRSLIARGDQTTTCGGSMVVPAADAEAMFTGLRTDIKQYVFTALYEHRYGSDTRAFKTEKLAYAWRDRIANEFWDQQLDDPKPAQDIGEAYFEKMSDGGRGEYFSVQQCEIEG